jgi:hypothetical protein
MPFLSKMFFIASYPILGKAAVKLLAGMTNLIGKFPFFMGLWSLMSSLRVGIGREFMKATRSLLLSDNRKWEMISRRGEASSATSVNRDLFISFVFCARWKAIWLIYCWVEIRQNGFVFSVGTTTRWWCWRVLQSWRTCLDREVSTLCCFKH